MQIDRYPDSVHKKIQTASSILSAFSEALSLAHIPKISVFTLPYKHQLRPGRPCCSLHALVRAPCLLFFTLPHLLCGSFPWPQRQIRVKCHYEPFTETPIDTLKHWWSHPSSVALTMSLQLTMTKVTFS